MDRPREPRLPAQRNAAAHLRKGDRSWSMFAQLTATNAQAVDRRLPIGQLWPLHGSPPSRSFAAARAPCCASPVLDIDGYAGQILHLCRQEVVMLNAGMARGVRISPHKNHWM